MCDGGIGIRRGSPPSPHRPGPRDVRVRASRVRLRRCRAVAGPVSCGCHARLSLRTRGIGSRVSTESRQSRVERESRVSRAKRTAKRREESRKRAGKGQKKGRKTANATRLATTLQFSATCPRQSRRVRYTPTPSIHTYSSTAFFTKLGRRWGRGAPVVL